MGGCSPSPPLEPMHHADRQVAALARGTRTPFSGQGVPVLWENGHRIASCPVRPKDPAALKNQVFAAPVKLIASSNHNEAISFFTFPSPDTLLILGFPWLQKHSPHTDWARKEIASCSSFCLANCPPGLCFVPNAARGAVIHWAYAAQFLCHPSVSRTITLLRCHFWWRLLNKDVKEYVSACSTFATMD